MLHLEPDVSNRTHDATGIKMLLAIRIGRLKQRKLSPDTPVKLVINGKKYDEFYYRRSSCGMVATEEPPPNVEDYEYGKLTFGYIADNKIYDIQKSSRTRVHNGKYKCDYILSYYEDDPEPAVYLNFLA